MPNAKILVVEDDPDVAEMTQGLLRSFGYEVPAVAQSGEEGIVQVAELCPDLVLTDIILKGKMDGVEVAEHVRSQFDIPVVYLTAYMDDSTVRRAKITEPFGYILKPFSGDELHTAIEIALYKHKMDKIVKERERWLATILTSISDGVVVTDVAGNVTFMNPVAESLTGWKQEAAIGRNLREVFLVENNKIPTSFDAHDVLPGRMSDFFNLSSESALISNEGTEKFVESSIAPIKDAAGNISGHVLIFRDITKHIQAKEALRVSVCQQAAVAELGRYALAETDLSTLEHEAVVLVAQNLDIEYCGVLDLLPERDMLLLRAGVGWKEGYVGSARVKAGPGSQFGYALRCDGPVIVQDLPTETRFRASPLLYQHGVISGISVVIHGRNEPFGILSAYSTGRRTLTADDSHFLQAIAHVLAAARERKRAEGTRTRLLERLISAQEEERRRIARELHDEAGQSLTSLLVGLRLIEDAHTIRQARAQANRLRHITTQTLEDIGRLARGLHPSILDDHGLSVALNRYASDFTQSCGIAVYVDAPPADATRLPTAVETAFYRIAQEALTNVAKYAEAKTVTIRLEQLCSEVRMMIEDDGHGFEVEQTLRAFTTSNHLGLYGMSERAALLRGCIAIKSKRGQGTTVSVRIPYEGGERLGLQDVEAGYVGISR